MRIDPKELGRILRNRLENSSFAVYGKDRKARTAAVFNILRTAAKDYGLVPYPDKAEHRRQLLCDFMWVEKPFRRLVLAAECEWNIGKRKRALLKDFRKLMLVRARIRLFIDQLPPKSRSYAPRRIRRRLAKELGMFHDHRRGDHYLLLEIDRRPKVRRIHGFYYQVGNDGRITKPTFARFGVTAASRH